MNFGLAAKAGTAWTADGGWAPEDHALDFRAKSAVARAALGVARLLKTHAQAHGGGSDLTGVLDASELDVEALSPHDVDFGLLPPGGPTPLDVCAYLRISGLVVQQFVEVAVDLLLALSPRDSEGPPPPTFLENPAGKKAKALIKRRAQVRPRWRHLEPFRRALPEVAVCDQCRYGGPSQKPTAIFHNASPDLALDRCSRDTCRFFREHELGVQDRNPADAQILPDRLLRRLIRHGSATAKPEDTVVADAYVVETLGFPLILGYPFDRP